MVSPFLFLLLRVLQHFLLGLQGPRKEGRKEGSRVESLLERGCFRSSFPPGFPSVSAHASSYSSPPAAAIEVRSGGEDAVGWIQNKDFPFLLSIHKGLLIV